MKQNQKTRHKLKPFINSKRANFLTFFNSPKITPAIKGKIIKIPIFSARPMTIGLGKTVILMINTRQLLMTTRLA